MSSVYFPVQIAAFIRRLVNVISTLSLTNQYLLSHDNHPFKRAPDPSTNLLSQHDPSWNWLVSTYKFSCADLANSVDSPQDNPTYGHGSSTRSDINFTTPSRSISSAASSPASPSPPSHPRDRGDSPSEPPHLPPKSSESQVTIHRLMKNPALFDPVRIPRYPLVLCHGLYGFDVRGPAAFPSLRLHYWSTVLSILKDKLGAEVIVTAVPGTGSIASRAENLDRILQDRARGRGINLMAHSMGGLDCRHLITHVRPREYVPLSLTSISTPHRGSPFMDWCAQYLGLGRRHHEPPNQSLKYTEQQTRPLERSSSTESNNASEKREAASTLSLSNLPSSFTTLLLSLLDSPAYANLTTLYLNDVFNPATPDDPRVKYFSVVSRIDDMNIWHPLWLPKMVLDDAEKKAKERLKAAAPLNESYHPSTIPLWEQENEWGNDGLVTVQSARWGEFLGILDGCDHWQIRGARGLEFNVDLSSVQLSNLTNRVAGDGALGEWTRFLGAWKRQEKGSSAGLELAQAVSSARETKEEADQIRRDSQDDPVVKASTDKLSAVFDWIVEHVPSSTNSSLPKDEHPVKKPVKHESATKFDLERFYIGLARRLYDEGL